MGYCMSNEPFLRPEWGFQRKGYWENVTGSRMDYWEKGLLGSQWAVGRINYWDRSGLLGAKGTIYETSTIV